MEFSRKPANDGRMQYQDRLAKLINEETSRAQISQADLAAQCGIPKRNFSHYKTRGSIPRDPDHFIAICRRLNTHPNYLLGWSDDRYPRDHDAQLQTLRAENAELRQLLLKQGAAKGKR